MAGQNVEDPDRRVHVPEVDSLRFLAVASVIAFHIGLGGLAPRAGWMGVWLFFVISGFVITLTIQSSEYKNISLPGKMKRFWIRRSLRIAPLYWAAIIGAYIYLLLFSSKNYLEHFPYLATFTYNFYRMSPDYDHTAMFGHYWSLSVEEQFYLVYPILTFLLVQNVRAMKIILTVALFASPAIRYLCGLLYFEHYDSARIAGNAVYQFSLGHFDAFAMGALVALNIRTIAASTKIFYGMVAASVVATLLYVALCVSLRESGSTPLEAIRAGTSAVTFGPFQHVVLYSVMNLVFATMVAGTVSSVKLYKTALSSPVTIYLGKISYGIYVFHFPLLWLYNNYLVPHTPGVKTPLGFLIYASILLAGAAFSFRFFEKPVLSLRRRFD